jgi:hypothetical protein
MPLVRITVRDDTSPDRQQAIPAGVRPDDAQVLDTELLKRYGWPPPTD